MQTLKDLIADLGKDPYEILNTDPNEDLANLRKNYRSLAIKYHPDKNEEQSAKLMFLKVNQAYEFLQLEQNRKIYQSYARVLEQQKKRVESMDERRKKFAQDLKQRQQQHAKSQAQMEKELQKRKQFFRKKMEQAQQRENIKKQIYEGMGANKFYEIISSFDVNWKEGLSFTENMLKSAFASYGKIDNINLQLKRKKATVTFNSIQDCTQVVKNFKHPLIRVSFHLQESKREHLLKALNKQKVQKVDLSLSSQNIQRFKQMINRGSGIYKQDYN